MYDWKRRLLPTLYRQHDDCQSFAVNSWCWSVPKNALASVLLNGAAMAMLGAADKPVPHSKNADASTVECRRVATQSVSKRTFLHHDDGRQVYLKRAKSYADDGTGV